ncbi:MAG: anti-sigma factor [Thermoanaerobaculia bacterium]
MTHEELISIVPLDVLGAATPEEASALAGHLPECEACSRDHQEYAEAATLLAIDLQPVNPPADTRARVLSATTTDEGSDDSNLIEAAQRFRMKPWWLATAATLFLALWGWRELSVRALHEKVIEQDAEIRRLSESNGQLSSHNEKLNSEMSEIASPQTRTIALAGQEVSPAATARVFLEPGRRRAVVFFYNMPVNPGDKSYQLWILRSDSPKPQSAGVFDVTPTGQASITVENLPVDLPIKGLAVTMEPRGGGEQPTNSRYYVMGKS